MKIQLVAFKNRLPVFDRNGKPIHVGDSVRVKRCVGRYGQTVTEEGEVLPQTKDNPEICPFGQFSYRTPDGRTESATIDFNWFTKDSAICYHKHHDFEHGHERWVEVLNQEES